MLSSPYDLEAHLAKKGTTAWVGYKVHLTETCDDDAPHLITNVETSAAPTADGALTPEIHAALKEKDLLPERHIVDTGYLDAELLVDSQQEYGVDLIGPTRPDYKWQAREGTGFAAEHFRIDWEHQVATCPEGKTSISWSPALDRDSNKVVKLKFSSKDCRPCPCRDLCFRSAKRYARRSITVRTEADYHALRAARRRETTDEFKEEYAKRAGIEGTISQGVRAFGLRPPPLTLHWSGQNASTAPRHCRCDQLRPGRSLALRCPARSDASLTLRHPDEGGRLRPEEFASGIKCSTLALLRGVADSVE